MLPINTIVRERYRIIYPIDERPIGQIYRARDEQNGRLVLLGVLPAADDVTRANIEKHVQQARAVRQDVLLPITEHFSDGARYIIACDDPGGQDVERQLRGGPLPEADVLIQAQHLSRAVAELHRERPPLLLGDLLPTDIVVSEDGTWRLALFTLFRHIGDAITPYRAPELLDTNVEPTVVSDTYALTALCYHALTGWPPTTAEQQAAGTPLNAPRALNPQLSTLIEQFLLRGLQQKPMNRYQNAQELQRAIDTVQMMAGRSLGLGGDVFTPTPEAPTIIPATPQPLQPVPVPVAVPPPAQPVQQPYPTGLYQPPQPGQQYPPQPGQQPYPTGQQYPPQPGQQYPPQPGQPYPAGFYPAPLPQKRSNGCLIAGVILLVFILLALCIIIGYLVFIPNNPISGMLRGHTATVASSSAPTAVASGTAPNTAQPSSPAMAAGPKTITLQNAGQITSTAEITNAIAGPLAFSPDGTTLALGVSNSVSLRALSDNLNQTRVLNGHTGLVTALAYAPNGTLLASGAINDHDVRLWNPVNGTLLYTLSGHTGWIRSLAFSPDNKLLASSATDKSVRLWNTTTGQLVQTLTGHTDWVGGIVFAPDGQTIASASRDGSVRLWDVTTGQQRSGFTFQMPNDANTNRPLWATSVSFSPDGKQLAVGGVDAVVRLLNPTTGAELRQLRGHNDWIVIRGLGFAGDGRTLVSASLDGTIIAWDTTSGVETGRFEGNRLDLAGIALSSDGAMLASASSKEGMVTLWSTADRTVRSSLQVGQGLITNLEYTPDSSTLGLVGYNGSIQIREPITKHGQFLTGAGSAPQPLSFLTNDTLVVISDQKSVILLKRTGAANQTLSGLDGQPLSVTTNGDDIAAGSSTGAITVWDASGKSRQTLRGDLKAITALTLSSDGALLAAAGPTSDPRIQIWDVANGKPLQTITDAHNGVVSLAFQPHGTLLAATDLSGALFVWDANGKHVYTVQPSSPQGRFTGLAFSPDGSVLAGGAQNGDIVFWDALDGKQSAQLAVPNASIVALAFSPDGKQLAVSANSEDAAVYVYGLP